MDENDISFLEKNGWTVECESPFEISHTDGSFVTGSAADYVLNGLLLEENNESLVNKKILIDDLIGRKFRRDKYGLSLWEDIVKTVSLDWKLANPPKKNELNLEEYISKILENKTTYGMKLSIVINGRYDLNEIVLF